MGAFKDYIQYKSIGIFHSSAVVAMQLLEDRKSLITCSRDDRKSLIILNLDYLKVTHSVATKRVSFSTLKLIFVYIIPIQGINCFVASCNKKLFITGSDDGLVRIWPLHKKLPILHDMKKSKSANYFNLNKPLETIRAGKTGIVDIVIFETLEMFICCSRDAVIIKIITDNNELQLIVFRNYDFMILQNTKICKT